MTRPLLPAALAAAIFAGGAAAQAPAVDRQARVWAAACAACHGTDGRAQGAMPVLAGRNAEELAQILIGFRNGQRPEATVMHQHAKGYTDDELRRLARFFAAQSR